jgi:hypothetical protein
MRPYVPFRFVCFDVETEPPGWVRGRGVECAPGEAGKRLGQLLAGDPAHEFQGYTDAAANEAKNPHQRLSRPGDRWFRTGDLLVRYGTVPGRAPEGRPGRPLRRRRR